MSRSPLSALLLAALLGACAPEDPAKVAAEAAAAEAAAAEAAAAEAAAAKAKAREQARQAPKVRSYEHPDMPYTDEEKSDIAALCQVLLACHQTRCKKLKADEKGNSDYGSLLGKYANDNEPKRATRRIAELVKADSLQNVDPACRQLVARVL